MERNEEGLQDDFPLQMVVIFRFQPFIFRGCLCIFAQPSKKYEYPSPGQPTLFASKDQVFRRYPSSDAAALGLVFVVGKGG